MVCCIISMNFMTVERKMSVEVLLAFRFNLGLSATVAAAVARSLCFEGLGRRFTQIHATCTGRIARFSGS